MKRIKLIIIILFIFSISKVDAQSFYRRGQYKTPVIHAGTGTAHYFGDLVDDWYFTVNGNFSVGIMYPLYDRFSVEGNVTWFRLAAADANSEVKAPRNLSFFSNNFELSALLHISLYPVPVRFYQRHMFNPYAFGGVGLLYFDPRAEYNGQKYSLRPLETEGVKYSPVTAAFPFGVGISIKLNAFINISLEGGFRYTLTDYMDDVSSGVYPDPSSFTDPIARKLSDRSDEYGVSVPFAEEPRMVRGDPMKKDSYLLILGKLEYYLSPLRDTFRAIRYKGTRHRKIRRRRR